MDEKLIRKHYGEKMWHFCRDNFSTILEEPNILYAILANTFYPTHHLYDDLVEEDKLIEFKSYIYQIYTDKDKTDDVDEYIETPEELMRKAGYTLYKCETESDIQSFKKYYFYNERLCTFSGGRLNSCFVFFAVKDNAEELNREDFDYPERQDEYGTSVISIQFSRDFSHTLSIKNRYNHTVNSPDATFSNNLDNIIPGLTKSFAVHYDMKQQFEERLSLENYVMACNGIRYRCKIEAHNIHYCDDNIIIDGSKPVFDYMDKSRYLIIDTYIIDLVEKKISVYGSFEDSFVDVESNIRKIEITNDEDKKYRWITLYHDEGISKIKICENQIIEYYNDFVEEIGDSFLFYNDSLRKISLKNVKSIGICFNHFNWNEIEIDIPSVIEIGNYFLSSSVGVKKLFMPNVLVINDNFLNYSRNNEEIYIPNVIVVGNYFLAYNETLKKIDMPKVEEIGSSFLSHNSILEKMNMPNIKIIGNDFLHFNTKLKKINLPNLESAGWNFLFSNEIIEEINLPSLKECGRNFMACADTKIISLPSLIKAYEGFMKFNMNLRIVNLPSLIKIGEDFLSNVQRLDELLIGDVIELGEGFLGSCCNLSDFDLPKEYSRMKMKEKILMDYGYFINKKY